MSPDRDAAVMVNRLRIERDALLTQPARQRGATETDLPNPHAKKISEMPTTTVIVGSAIGLHARPAAIIAEAVVKAGVPVTLSVAGGKQVDAGSALMIMTLDARNGAEVTITSEDEAVLATIAGLVERDLDA